MISFTATSLGDSGSLPSTVRASGSFSHTVWIGNLLAASDPRYFTPVGIELLWLPIFLVASDATAPQKDARWRDWLSREAQIRGCHWFDGATTRPASSK
jgi:hypothetical protein